MWKRLFKIGAVSRAMTSFAVLLPASAHAAATNLNCSFTRSDGTTAALHILADEATKTVSVSFNGKAPTRSTAVFTADTVEWADGIGEIMRLRWELSRIDLSVRRTMAIGEKVTEEVGKCRVGPTPKRAF